jgi:hypothetical protein
MASALVMDFEPCPLQGSQNHPGPQDRQLRTH